MWIVHCENQEIMFAVTLFGIFLRFLIIRKMLIEITDNAFSCLEINKTYYIELKENSKCSARYEKVEI